MSEMLERTKARLEEIASKTDLSVEAKVQSILEVGLETFGLSLGIVSHIVSTNYTVEYVAPADAGLNAGHVFYLPRTYCDITVKLKRTLGIPQMKISTYNAHPCYADFGLESYFGTPLLLDGVIYGTLNFTAKEAHETGFSSEEKSALELMAHAVATLLRSTSSSQVT